MCGPSITGWRFAFCRAGCATKPQVRRGKRGPRKRSSRRFWALECSVCAPQCKMGAGGVDLAEPCRGVTLWACPAL